MSKSIWAVVSGLLAMAIAQGPPFCTYTDPSGLTFNVCNLVSSSSDYQLNDPTDVETHNSTIVFNIGQAVVNPPNNCQNYGAYQLTNGGCYGLAGPSFSSSNVQFALLDQQNLARGFTMSYSGGQPDAGCTGSASARALTIEFHCGQQGSFPAPGQATVGWVNEFDTCQYHVISHGPFGCPTQCPTINNQICGGTGVCGYDDAINNARCFCNQGWTGNDCQTQSNPFPSGAVAGATIGGMLISAGALLGFAYLKR